MLIAVSVALAALHARADAPGPMPEEGVTPASPAAATEAKAEAAPPGGAHITAGDLTARPIVLSDRVAPTLRARELHALREQEGLRRERELELQAAAIHASECYREWGETTCVPKLK
jgi:hypothetical protein